MHLPTHVFRAYDIRGKAHTEISENLCALVGKAFGSELKELYTLAQPTVIVGRDARTHSLALEEAVIAGLLEAGCNVHTIGQTPSPINYFALCDTAADGSVQITASHNDKEDNGLKLQTRNAEALSGKALQDLRVRIEEGRFLEGEGSRTDIDVITPYEERVMELVTMKRKLTVVVDFGNGVAGPVYGAALQKAGIKVIPLFAEPDGTFPNHAADPTQRETLQELQNTVRKEQADCGLAFDGDGDRVGVVDENGVIVSPDYLLLLLAQDHLQRHPGATIIYTISMSSMIETEIARMGGKTAISVVGHSPVEHTMRKHGSHLAAEQSGHFFCGENFYDYDDALVASLRLLSIFSQHSGTFSSLFAAFPTVYQSPEWRPVCSDDQKAQVIASITEHFSKEYPCITIDGVRIDFGEGAWAGIRQSNTSPKISICAEARDPKKLTEVEKIVRDHLASYPAISQ